MDDLIRRQDVIDIIMGDGLYCDTYDDKEYSAERIKSIPTVEPRKGKWIWKNHDDETGIDDHFWCSECGYPQAQIYDTYCAVCGARMEERR